MLVLVLVWFGFGFVSSWRVIVWFGLLSLFEFGFASFAFSFLFAFGACVFVSFRFV